MLLAYIAIVMLVAVAALILSRQVRRSEPPRPSAVSPGVWVSEPAEDGCRKFQFPPRLVDTLLVPGANTLQPDILDAMSGEEAGGASCVDPDTTIAQKMKRTCTANSAASGTPVCSTLSGQIVGEGYVEEYYRACVTEACAGTVALITAGDSRKTCLDVLNGDIVGAPCDPLSETQQFVVTRRSSTSTASQGNGGGQSGPLAQLKHRASGLCLTTSDSELANTSGPAPCQADILGNRVVLDTCTKDYEWIMAPSSQYCRFPGRGPNDVCCSGGTQCNNGTPTGNLATIVPCCQNTPQQFVRSTSVPAGASTPEQLEDGRALAYGGSGAVVAVTYSLDRTSCAGKAATANYVSLATYNYQSEQALCQDNPAACLPL